MAGTLYKDYPCFWGMSLSQVNSLSYTGGALNRWSGWSVSGSFVPQRTINPATTVANEVMQILCTLVMDILRPRSN